MKKKIPLRTCDAKIMQGSSFCEWAQPMRGDVTLLCCLSLAGRVHKMVPDYAIINWSSLFLVKVCCLINTKPFTNQSRLFALQVLRNTLSFQYVKSFSFVMEWKILLAECLRCQRVNARKI